MVSKNEIKLITSLSQKKYRKKHLLFVAEGEKLVNDLIKSHYEIHHIYATENIKISIDEHLLTYVSKRELQKISTLKTSNTILGVFKIPEKNDLVEGGIQIVLDGIKDPGNLGTIIRLCDWFGVSQLVCSEDTVDCYNPKVVQATMGSLANVNITYINLETFLKNNKTPKYISLLEGENIYQQSLPKDAIIVIGNEANGVSNVIQKLADHKLTIPKFGKTSGAESLNAAMATAVILSEFTRLYD